MLKYLEKKRDIIKNFLPSWFAVIMGFGIIISSSMAYSSRISYLQYFAKVLAYINIALFVILLIPWILRWIFYKKNAMADFKHPIMTNFYPTITIAAMIIALNLQMIGVPMNITLWIWFAGAIGTIFLSISIPFMIFNNHEIALHHVNPSWFIPPVGLIAIPLFGYPFLSLTLGILNQIVLLFNYFGLGAGIMLYISLLTITLHRFITHPPLPNVLAPTIWIGLGPIGAGIVALLNLIGKSTFVTIKEPFNVFSLLFWGFGLWWAFLTFIMTLYYAKKLKLPYSLSWWAFIFPFGVFVVSSHMIGVIFPSIAIIDGIGFVFYLLLLILWLITLIMTLKSGFTGKVFIRESLQDTK